MTQKEALDVLKLGRNVFLTGAAGSGKTYAISTYIDYLKRKHISVAITASSGIASAHIGGITINSWSGIGIKRKLTSYDIEELLKRRYLRRRIVSTRVLIIDEISMLSGYALDMVDKICREFRNSIKPFGGIPQVILCGDFFQLPPVVKDNEESNFAYESDVWNELNLSVCYLEEEYRYKDRKLITILNEIRRNKVSDESHKILVSRIQNKLRNSAAMTKLYTHNFNVDTVNAHEISKINEKSYVYEMTQKGTKSVVISLKRGCLAPERLELKKGAFVMFVKNNFDEGYVNGTLGTVIDFTLKGYPIVETLSKKVVKVLPATWSINEFGIQAQIKQLPLRLAWAITIHKSQGMSMDAAEIDLSDTFVPGMGYVALSRVRTLDGISLIGFDKKSLEIHKDIIQLDAQFQEQSKSIREKLKQLNWLEKQLKQIEFVRILKRKNYNKKV